MTRVWKIRKDEDRDLYDDETLAILEEMILKGKIVLDRDDKTGEERMYTPDFYKNFLNDNKEEKEVIG